MTEVPFDRRSFLKTAGAGVLAAAGLSQAGGADDDRKLWRSGLHNDTESSPTVADGKVFVESGDSYLYTLDAADGTQQWRFYTGGQSMTVSDGTVFTGSWDEKVYALDADDGTELWDSYIGGSINIHTAVDGTLFFVSGDSVYAVNADDGSEQWQFKTDGNLGQSLTVVDGTVYVGTEDGSDGKVYALDAGDGTERWRFDAGYRVHSPPSVVDETVFVGSHAAFAVDADDGTEQWRFDAGGYPSLTVVDGTVFADFTDDMYAVDADDGTEQWRFIADDNISHMTVSEGTVFAGTVEADVKQVYALDTSDGTEQWRLKSRDGFSSPTVTDGTVFIGSYDGYLYALDAQDGTERWRFETGDLYAPPTVADGTVFAVGDDLYAVDAAVEDPPAGRPAITLDDIEGDTWEVTRIAGNDVSAPFYEANPTIELKTARRYRIYNDGRDTHPLAIRDEEGQVLLSQSGDGTFEDDPAVDWRDEGDVVSFTLTAELADEISEYDSTAYSEMVGELEPVRTVAEFADPESDTIEVDGVRTAVNEWQSGDIETELLRGVINAWTSGERF